MSFELLKLLTNHLLRKCWQHIKPYFYSLCTRSIFRTRFSFIEVSFFALFIMRDHSLFGCATNYDASCIKGGSGKRCIYADCTIGCVHRHIALTIPYIVI